MFVQLLRRPLCHGYECSVEWLMDRGRGARVSRVEEPIRWARLSTVHPAYPSSAGSPDVSHAAMHWATRRWSAKQLPLARVAGPNLTLPFCRCPFDPLYRRTICAALAACPVAERVPCMHASASFVQDFSPVWPVAGRPFHQTVTTDAHRRPVSLLIPRTVVPLSPSTSTIIQQCPRS